jgi:predicted alpha/beta superfamily hydrolase
MLRWPRSLFRWKPRRRKRGTLHPLGPVSSHELGNTRNLLVYLPPGYERGDRRYPVIYMQDGQNLFDPATSFAGDWGLLAALDNLSLRGAVPIVVAISNMGEDRIAEYSPFVDSMAGGGRGDEYLEFVLNTVKPGIDREFRTIPDRESTGLAGSSMGGLISLYGFFRRPEAFGFSASLSPSLWFADAAIFPFVEAAPHVSGRIYLDIGTDEGSASLANARRMRQLLLAKGYRDGVDLQWVEEPGGGHTEAAWGRRFKSAVPFLITARNSRRED